MEGTFPVGLIECCLLSIRFCCSIFENRLETIVYVSDIIFGDILKILDSVFFINVGITRSLLILINIGNIGNNPVDEEIYS